MTNNPYNLNKHNSNCSQCGLQNMCFPKGLFRTDIDLLESLVTHHPCLSKGEYLFKAGDAFVSLFAIKAGLVKVYSNVEGKEVIHGFYLPGDVLGVDAIVSQKYKFNARALDMTSVCGIKLSEMDKIYQLIPHLNNHVLNIMSEEILGGRLHSELLTKKSADQRVAYFLWGMVERFKSRGYHYTEFRLSILHKEMATYLNLTPETVSRVLSNFSRKSIMTWKKKEVLIYDLNALEKLAHTSID